MTEPQNPSTRQQNPRDPEYRAEYRDDEIDLGELISHIWNTKWRVVISMVLVAMAYVVYLSVTVLTSGTAANYSQVFDLNFEGLSDGEFPDGSPFSMSDIISPTVLGRVHRDNELERYDISVDGLRRAISIEPYSPDYFLIRARYQRQLANSDLSSSEIADLQNSMQSEMSVAQSGGVRLSLQLPSGELPERVANKVLTDIANTWALRAIEERGVLSLNLPIYSERIFDERRFNELDYLLGIELLLENIGLIQNNVEALKAQPNAASVRDEETGFSLEDLAKAIRDVEEYDLRQLIDPVQELGLTRNENTVRLFYNRQLQDLRLEKRGYEERARITREVMTNYARDDSSRPGGIPLEGSSLSSPQLGDSFLDRLVEISRQGGAQEFRQALTQEILGYENRALDIDQRMAEIELTLEALSADRGEEAAELRAIYAEEVQERLPQILETLRDYTNVVGRMHDQLSRQAAGSISEIITPQGGSFMAQTTQPIENRHIMIFIALMVLTAFAALFGSLIADMMKRRKNL